MAHKDRKTQRQRGSATCGYGNRKKHRGKGSRGGIGMAGSKKHKWNKISKTMPNYFGHTGFTLHKSISPDIKVVNVGFLQEHIGSFVSKGVASKEGKAYRIDLTQTGYGKLLGSGKVDVKLNVKVDSCSARAKEKIEAAGGSVEAAAPAEEAAKGVEAENVDD